MKDESAAGQTVVTLARVLDTCLRLLHPFTPFITEELWGHLRQALLGIRPSAGVASEWPEALIVARWPEPRALEGWEEAKVADFALVQEIVRSIRNLRAETRLSPVGRILPATLAGGSKTALADANRPESLRHWPAWMPSRVQVNKTTEGEACRECRARGWRRGDLPPAGGHG